MVHSGRTCRRTGPAAKHVVFHARMLGNRPKSCRWDLNPGPRPYQGRALPTEPRQQRCLSPRGLSPHSLQFSLISAWKRRLDHHDRHASSQERVMGIEPTQPAWKAGALPLSYTRVQSWFRLDPCYRRAGRKSHGHPPRCDRAILIPGTAMLVRRHSPLNFLG
jgi:hypothetical protein